eukprot:9485249-Pyramimonas_sp.AAC.1
MSTSGGPVCRNRRHLDLVVHPGEGVLEGGLRHRPSLAGDDNQQPVAGLLLLDRHQPDDIYSRMPIVKVSTLSGSMCGQTSAGAMRTEVGIASSKGVGLAMDVWCAYTKNGGRIQLSSDQIRWLRKFLTNERGLWGVRAKNTVMAVMSAVMTTTILSTLSYES